MMIDCHECKHHISDEADLCPHCGAPVNMAGGGIKAHQILGLAIVISGLAVFLIAKEPTVIAVGGMLLVVGFITTLL